MLTSVFLILAVFGQAEDLIGDTPVKSAVDVIIASELSDGFTDAIIRDSYNKNTSAICLLRYSLEITNPNSGQVSKRDSHALGIIVREDGLVMAHGHMFIENREPFNIKAIVGEGENQKEYDVTLLSKPDDVNITFLRIETEEEDAFPYLSFADEQELEVGTSLMLIGVLGESLDYARAMQTRRVGAILLKPRITYCLDQPISFGYVGGPVVNDNGNVFGVLGFDLSSAEGGDLYTRSGHPLIYQAALFQKYIEEPPAEAGSQAEADDAWLGVFTQPLTDDFAEYWSMPKDGGIVVSTVIKGSPADRVGLQAGDVIIDFNGTEIKTKLDREVLGFTKLVRESPIGEVLPVKLIRDGKPTEIRLTLSPRPKSAQDALEYEDTLFGITVREITTDVRLAINLADDVRGVIVRRVKSGSPADIARIRPRYIILSFGGYDIAGVEEFTAALEAVAQAKPAEVTVFCRVGARTAFFRIQPRWNN